MTRDADLRPNLRYRKRQDVAVGTQKERGFKEETKPVSISKNEHSPVDISSTGGYVLMPLRERRILARLDVGPFLLSYGLLVLLDFRHEQPTPNNEGGIDLEITISSFSLVAFPLILCIHFWLFLVQQWSISLRAKVGYEQVDTSGTSFSTSSETLLSWTHCLVEAPNVDTHQSSQNAAIVTVKHDVRKTLGTVATKVIAVVNFQDIIFRCNVVDDYDSDTFLWSNDDHPTPTKLSNNNNPYLMSGLFHRLRYPINLPLSFYENWGGHKTMELLQMAQETYGTNTTQINLPPFLDLLQEQVVAPFFLFQMLCVLLWSLDEYWYYAMFTFFALLMFESTTAFSRLKSLERLRSYTAHSQRRIWVYRPSYPPLGKIGWVNISVAEIVPGDIVSCKQITSRTSHRNSNVAQNQHRLNQIPADILILNGDAVADESQITGESIPQLKAPLDKCFRSMSGKPTNSRSPTKSVIGSTGTIGTVDETLDLQEHKQSVVFGGTTLLVSRPGATPLSRVSQAPDDGAIGMVLRTGFETAQGSLLRTMAHTQMSVDGIHNRDTYVFILMLLCCAVASAFMVWKEGSIDPTRNKFRLLLHVVIIITSVVPPELPMELSLAITNSVADLLKQRIFCTENFRIPLAGQVNVCCFDKTGTLTSDDMRLKGLRLVLECCDKSFENERNNNVSTDVDTVNRFTDVLEPNMALPWSALRIMAACHSLALNVGNLSQTADGDRANDLIGDPLEKAVLENTGYKMIQKNALRSVDAPPENRPGTILILKRFGFSSKLKRMSVLSKETGSEHTWVLTKGAPETVKQYLRSDSIPPDYDDVSTYHMALGQRVLAIAYRKLTREESDKQIEEISRDVVESNLVFVGFLLLHCPVKSDSGPVVSELWNSGNRVVMITGDAMHTAVEVARQVGIIRKSKKSFPRTLQLKHYPCNRTKEIGCDFRDEFQFVSLSNDAELDVAENLTLTTAHMTKLKIMVAERKIALCISGSALQQLVTEIMKRNGKNLSNGRMFDEKQYLLHPTTQDVLKDIIPMCLVFARCNPRQKEAIVAAFNLGGFITLMCGDGTNDVGALRRAHVGISIISAPEVEAKQRSASKAMSKVKADHKKGRRKNSSKKEFRARKISLEKTLRELQEVQDELDQIELGDASVASPFTSRMVSIKCCKVVLQQGRCTLVTMLQIYKILGVNCLVNATILSNLFLHGVKQGDRQLTILGIIVAGLFFLVTRGKPLPNLSATLPPASVLCTQSLVSIGSQFSIHYSFMIVATEIALYFVDPYDPSMIPDGPFNPNTLNTCTFLISVLATVNTFAVNYRGEPFVEPLRGNKILWKSLQLCYVILFACALEIFPPLNDLFQLAEFPDVTGDGLKERMIGHSYSNQKNSLLISNLTSLVQQIGFKLFICGLMLCDTILVFSSEKLVLRYFRR